MTDATGGSSRTVGRLKKLKSLNKCQEDKGTAMPDYPAQQCKGCKSRFLLDEHYQVVCTGCGLCNSTEPTPTMDGITELISLVDISTKPTATQLQMAEEHCKRKAPEIARVAFKRRRKKKKKLDDK